jgi:hypothetical protein
VTPGRAASTLPGMNSPVSPRRLLVGAALATTALVAVPSLASASTCDVNSLGQFQIFDTSGNQTLVVKRSGQFIGFQDGELANMQFCDGPRGFATVTNTSMIIVRGTTAQGGGGLKIDQSFGALAPGDFPESDGLNEIEVLVDSSNTSGHKLVVTGTPGADTIKVSSGGGVGMGNDTDVDIRDRNATSIDVFGLAGGDFITGRGTFPSTAQKPADRALTLFGGSGSDTLVDGLAEGDILSGEGDNDTLFEADARGDQFGGGAGFDTATIDSSLDEAFNNTTESVSNGGVGKLRLAPAVVKAKAGKTAHMRMSWTHPKAWKQLRKIAVRVYDGGELVTRVLVRPRQAEHHGKTVSADLKLKLPKALAGHQLRVDVEATDRKGHRQLEPSAGLVRVR